jgi:1-acyl-sn-glycerol-3-phosphate acyltransferase
VSASGGFVLSSNQLSNLDGFALSYTLYPRQLRWMAKAEVFVPVIDAIVRRLGLKLSSGVSTRARRRTCRAVRR